MLRVLLIEDDFDLAQILVECLQSDSEFDVEQVISNQSDARERFASGFLHNVDAVLMDLQLPLSTSDHTINPSAGLELVEELRTVHNFTRTVIILTNSTEPRDAERALRAGCDGYLGKYMRTQDLPGLLTELRMVLRGEVFAMSNELKHIFLKSALQAGAGR